MIQGGQREVGFSLTWNVLSNRAAAPQNGMPNAEVFVRRVFQQANAHLAGTFPKSGLHSAEDRNGRPPRALLALLLLRTFPWLA